MSNIMRRPSRVNNNPINIFDGIFNDGIFDGFFVQPTKNNLVATDVKRTDTSYEISMAIPGVPKESVNLDLNNNTLTVSYETENKGENSLFTNSFTKSWTLPEGTDAELITARSKDGILTVDIPTNTNTNVTRNITIK